MAGAAVKGREAGLRVIEARELRAATARARAAKHARKVLTIRTNTIVETITRATLSMRIARSSRQAPATPSLLKASPGQARLGAADKPHAAPSSRPAMLVAATLRSARPTHTRRWPTEGAL